MWGAVIGDLAGSIYEFEQCKKIEPVEVKELIQSDSFFSDDTILTIAVLEAFLTNKNYEYFLKKYAKEYINYKPSHKPYFEKPFSPGFIKWANGNYEVTSTGNGAMMRISSIGYLSETDEELIENVKSATSCSHNSESAINNAIIIAKIISLASRGEPKEEIIKKLNIKLNYKPFKEFNMTCETTIDNCLYALFTSDSFEESLKKVISYGGDTDTNACIVGSMAEALYGIDIDLIEQAKTKIPDSFVKILNKGYVKKEQKNKDNGICYNKKRRF